jgi:hypothetical protein
MMWRTGIVLVFCAASAVAGVLPEERADALYHYYDGGGVEIDGPSLLVRKSVNEKVSVSASYYVDSISSASIDVVTTASKYSEERTQWGMGVDYLHEDTTMSLGFSSSDENDYQADTLNFAISQDIFSGLTTVTLGYGSGADDVSRRGDTDFSGEIDRHAYRVGLTQVLTRNLLMSLNYEAIADEGYLNNPLSAGSLCRCRAGQRLRLAGRDLSEHPRQQCRRDPCALSPAVPGGCLRQLSLLHR